MYLNCHSYFSLRYGTLSPKQLVETAKKWGISALVLTDINNTSCAGEFVRLCKKEGIKPILGIDFRDSKGQRLYIGIAKNEEGFYELNKLLTDCSLDRKFLPASPSLMENTFIIFPRLIKPIQEFKENEFLGIRPEHIHRLFSAEVRHFPQKLVILSPLTFLNEEGYKTHQLLRAIDLNIVLSKLTKKDIAKKTEAFNPPDVLLKFYQIYPKIIQNTKRLIDTCSINLESGLHNNRKTFTGDKESDFKLLEKLALGGCKKRYDIHDLKALERVKRELKVIYELGFCAYFLITWDIIRYAQSVGYHHVGRGSGANSIVAFCLRITDVDPLELDLYFERFINPHRTSPPDFDIDFSWDERDDVTDYIFKRYGREYTALLATYSTFKGKSIIRELGKVFGLPKAEIDKIIDDPLATNNHEIADQVFKFGKLIEGFPNYLSIHAGGVVITEKPINYFTALQLMPKGFPITHFDMYHGEDFGFHKYDILSQRGLGHIKDAVDLVKMNQGRAVDIHEIEKIKEDSKVKAQLRSGHCIGCFYIESPAMRGLLSKLNCDNYVHLVAASSIIRPGVSKSGMMREYIRRFHNPNSFEYLHPVFEKNLGETFGVMVYQEDVMKIVHHFAGLDLDESDVLRRIMTGKKYKGDTFKILQKKYFDNCKQRGYPDELIKEVWRQIESFSGYSFCKAHSASFAVESFQSLYLKAYYPLEFMVAVINNFGGFYRTEYYFHEARMAGAEIHAPCVNQSQYLTSISGKNIYVGFVHVHSLERKTAHRIVFQRAKGGVFRSLADFVNRVEISAEQLELLIRIGAFRFTEMNKYELMWEKNAVFNPKEKFESTGLLFEDMTKNFQLPELKEGEFDQTFDEIELLGFSVKSPFELLMEPNHYDCFLAKDLKGCIGRIVKVLGYYVCKKNVRTIKNQLMNFGTWLDSEGHFFDTTHFPNFLKMSPFRGKGIYKIEGKVVEEYGFPSIEVIKMERLPFVQDERYVED
ncbi:MAG: DNA polymerase III subunit alpha [Bacteroidetes bacterium]|nr:DNA polymerase III subunit alpha [Bacteroidota bacterium]